MFYFSLLLHMMAKSDMYLVKQGSPSSEVIEKKTVGGTKKKIMLTPFS